MPDEFALIPEDASNNGCPLLTKTRVIEATKGVCSTVVWEVRDRNGQPLDLGDYLCNDADGDSVPDDSESDPGSVPFPLCGQVVVRFADAVSPGTIFQAIGWTEDADSGVIKVELPSQLVQYPGVYTMEVAISQQVSEGVYKLLYIDRGIVSVERSLFGSTDLGDLLGPPTIKEIRIAMRDSGLENSLLNDVEFDDTEILHALARPLRQWNETPPPVAYYDSRSFPFHEHWLKATMALLMRSAAFWYERNRLAATHGGVTVDDRNKMQPYLTMSQLMYKEWEDFIINQKVAINVANCYGAVGSPYSGW